MSAPTFGRRQLDLLRLPVAGAVLRWRHLRTTLQSISLAVALLIVYDGFFGPAVAPRNVAGVLPWVQWRGLVVLSLLLLGNLFCMACPFILLGRLNRLLPIKRRSWPKRLQSKWLAAALLVAFFWAYEALGLWSSPSLTAGLTLGYFLLAFTVDGFFRGSAFCKYVCPIGQFHFVNSTSSPFEVGIRSASVCASCRTLDCIAGRREGRPASSSSLPRVDVDTLTTPRRQDARVVQRGCELWLFQPQKVGNVDCTFCLDCIHACPHDNVGVMQRTPTAELWQDLRRSGVGKLGRRPDLAAMALVLTFAAPLNAFGMIGPFGEFAAGVATALGTHSQLAVLTIVFVSGLTALPLLVVGASAAASKALGASRDSISTIAVRYAYGLTPMGFGIWLAHYGFHFLTGALTFVPVFQSLFADWGTPFGGQPAWDLGPLVPASWLLPIEFVLLEGGLVASIVTLYRIAVDRRGSTTSAWREVVPWIVVTLMLFASAVWLMLQPMQMRGTIFAS